MRIWMGELRALAQSDYHYPKFIQLIFINRYTITYMRNSLRLTADFYSFKLWSLLERACVLYSTYIRYGCFDFFWDCRMTPSKYTWTHNLFHRLCTNQTLHSILTYFFPLFSFIHFNSSWHLIPTAQNSIKDTKKKTPFNLVKVWSFVAQCEI